MVRAHVLHWDFTSVCLCCVQEQLLGADSAQSSAPQECSIWEGVSRQPPALPPFSGRVLWGQQGAELPMGSGPAVCLKPLGHPMTPLQDITWSNVEGQGSRKRAGAIGRVLEVAVKVKGAGSDWCWIQDMSRAEISEVV